MSGYQTDPNDSTKSIPAALPKQLSGSSHGNIRFAALPAEKIVSEQPSYVLVNRTGSFSFAYQCIGSLGDTSLGAEGGNWILGISSSTLLSSVGQFEPIRLDITPCAWSSSTADVGAAGDVTFVYSGK